MSNKNSAEFEETLSAPAPLVKGSPPVDMRTNIGDSPSEVVAVDARATASAAILVASFPFGKPRSHRNIWRRATQGSCWSKASKR
jgi:hypothetical protein